MTHLIDKTEKKLQFNLKSLVAIKVEWFFRLRK